MKNFTKQNFKTNPLWIRLLIMAFMLLAGAENAWAAGFWGDNAWNIKFYSPSQGKDMWINDNYDSGHKGGSTIYLGTFTSAPYLKGYWTKTWGYGNNTSKYVKIKFNNITTSDGVSKQWDSNGDQMWRSESLNIKFPDSVGPHKESITFTINEAETMTCYIEYEIEQVCEIKDDSKIRIEIASNTSYTKVYAWYDSNSELLDSWPGTSMTSGESNIDGTSIKYIDIQRNNVSVDEKVNIIFNDGNNKTGDITGLQWGKVYKFDKDGGSKVSQCLPPACESPAAPNVTGTTNVVKCGNNVTTNGTITIDNYVNTSTYKLQLGSNEAQTVTPTNGVFSVSESGTYKLTVTNDCGESSTKSNIVVGLTQNQVSISDITGPDNICSGSSADYSITDIDGVTYNWSIDPADKFTLGTNGSKSIKVTADGTESTTATLTITATKNSCPTTNTKTIKLIPLPTISTVSPTEGTVCTGTTIGALENTLTITKSDNSTTKWYKGGEELPSTSVVESGEYTIKAVSNTASCLSSSGVTYNVTGITTIPTGLTVDINGQSSASICGGTATINAKATGASSYSLYKGNGDLVGTINGDANGVSFTVSETNTYKVKATNNCGSTEFSSDVTLTVNPVPSLTNVGNVTLCSSSTPISVAELIAETKATASNSATIKLYDGNEVEITSPININTQTTTTTTYKLKASTQTCSSNFVSFTLTVNPLPVAPSLTNPEPVCEGTTVNLPTENLKWYNAKTGGNVVSNTAITATGTYWAAAVENGCESATRTRYDVTVNPKPTITGISVNNSTPVINEDVLLTVEGGDIETVEWSITSGNNASLSDASGNSVKLTSTASGAVTVTATAISSNGCRATSTKEVTFSETENCTGNISYDIQITFYHPSTYNEYDSQKGQWWGMGTMYYSTDKKSWLTKDMGDATSGSKTVTIQNITSEKLYVYFESKWTYHVSYKASTKEDIEELTRGNRYDIRITSHGNDNEKATSEAAYTGSLSTPAPLSAPAVKTVSATSEEGSGIVTFTGKIVKTGCAAKSSIYYGYQFKKVDEEWPTSGTQASNTPEARKLIPCTNASATALNYQFSANVEGLEDGNYHFRAYIINGYNFTNGNYDQGVYYGLDKLVTVSTVKEPVRSARIELTALDGTPVEAGHKYCIGSTAYIKVTSDVKYTTATWKSDLGVEIEQTRTSNIYQFVVKGNDEIVVLLSNRHNDEPVSSEPLNVEVYASASVPEIALGASSICDTNEDGTTLTVTRTKAGQYYALYKEDGNGGTLVEDYQLCSTDDAEIEFTGLKEAAKYFVKTYTSECPSAISVTSSTTLTVVDSKDVKISIEAITTETTPWMPAKLTVKATGDYTITSDPNDAVINISGNIVKVKLPLPTEGVINKGTTENDVNVTFTAVPYTITAALKTTGDEANPCARPAEATITLVHYEEPCTQPQP